MITRMRRRQDGSRGQALVEFALIIPIFLLVVVGIFDGGRALYTYNALSNATREALREAIVHQDVAAIDAEANNILGGLAPNTTIIHDTTDCTPVVTLCSYRIEMRHPFSPILLGAIFRPEITAEGEMPVEFPNP